MRSYFVLILSLALFYCGRTSAQDSIAVQQDSIKTDKILTNKERASYEPLAPAKAAFYSAVLPGLGQAYNKSYWKIPLVYAGIGTSVYFYKRNNDQFHSYRDAYKRRLAGYNDDEYQGQISDDGLIQAQKLFRKNKEVSIFVAVAFYALNIVDANVEAHLRQFNVSKHLVIEPNYDFDQIRGESSYGLSFNVKF